jgi:hypothetical protein
MKLDGYIKQASGFAAQMDAGVLGFGETYVKALEEWGDEARTRFRNEFPQFGEGTWDAFVAIGEGRMLPEFIWASDSLKKAVLRSPRSLSQQKKLLATRTGKAPGVEASAARKNIRDAARLPRKPDYVIFGEGKNRKVVFYRRRAFTVAELRAILKELEQ